MKKIVLLLSLCLLATIGGAQVIFYVQAPSPNEGSYGFTFPVPGADWGVPDLNDPANAVLAEVVLVDDGSGLTDPTSCDPVVNDLTGKIAALYRGSCEFGLKAKNAQDAGAIAVIIINNLGGAPVAMGGGAVGLDVNVPVCMISNVDGALLRAEIDAGGLEVFLGSKNGLYANDLGITEDDFLRAERFGNIQALSQDDTEFSVGFGSWVRNYGTNEQTGVVLNVTIGVEGAEVYNENSDGTTIPSGDSIYIPMPTYSAATYANGYYTATYTVSSDAADESDFDNQQSADFHIGDEAFSLSKLDPGTEKPFNNTNLFETASRYDCLFFEDENASRVGIEGMNFSAGTSQNPDPTSLDGQLVEAYVYEWNDEWVDLDDAGFALDDLNDIADAEYIYTENLQGENVFIPFEEPFLLEDDQRYLFCVQTYGSGIFPGYDVDTKYTLNTDTYLMPGTVIFRDGNWFGGGTTAGTPSISAQFFDASEVGLVELPNTELEAFPNPSNQIIHIPLKNKDGNVTMTIVDLNGKVIDTQSTAINGVMLDVDVTAFAAGMYVINLEFDNGETGSINVMVTK